MWNRKREFDQLSEKGKKEKDETKEHKEQGAQREGNPERM